MPVADLCRTTRLGEDLGMDGDDAVDFFEDFAETFRVDLADMRWDRHFGPEGCNPLIYLWPPFWVWRARTASRHRRASDQRC